MRPTAKEKFVRLLFKRLRAGRAFEMEADFGGQADTWTVSRELPLDAEDDPFAALGEPTYEPKRCMGCVEWFGDRLKGDFAEAEDECRQCGAKRSVRRGSPGE